MRPADRGEPRMHGREQSRAVAQPSESVAAQRDTSEADGRRRTVRDPGVEFVWTDATRLWAGQCEVASAPFKAFRPHHGTGEYRGQLLTTVRYVFTVWPFRK